MLKKLALLCLIAGVAGGAVLSKMGKVPTVSKVGWHIYQTHLAHVDSANAPTDTLAIFIAPYSGVLHGVVLVPDEQIVGQDTNTRKWVLLKKSGTSYTKLDSVYWVNGTNGTAGTGIVLYEPSSALSMSGGDALVVKDELVGNGQALPGALYQIVYEGR